MCLLQDCLSPLSMQALPAAPESLCIVEMGGPDTTRDDAEGGSHSGLFLNIGLQVLAYLVDVSCDETLVCSALLSESLFIF